MSYWLKWRGAGKGAFPPVPAYPHLASSFVSSFVGIGVLAALHYHAPALFGQWMIGSFGATAVLLYAVPESPLAQPRNLLVGHVGSAVIGQTVNVILPHDSTRWLACALAVSLAITFMQATRTVHPPGGATALIAVAQDASRAQGFLYCVYPVLVGAFIMLVIALVCNNIVLFYPAYWVEPDANAAPTSAPSAAATMPDNARPPGAPIALHVIAAVPSS